jgi:alkylation response protein AidB-like acyl-CoA dehydrogenase
MNFKLSKEQRDIVRAARKFAQGEFPDRALEFDREETFDLELWRKACDLGFVGLFIDPTYDGAGMGLLDYCLINEEFWAVDPGIAAAILSCTFGSELIGFFGSEDQKELILPQLVSGQAIIGTTITEPDTGSDLTGATTTAIKEGNEWVINGNNMVAINGNIAKYILIFCQTDPENPTRHKRYSFILVPTDKPGYKSKKIEGQMGIRALDRAEVALHNVRVPLANLVGKEGEGFHELMTFFNHTRLYICAQAVGVARAALEESINHAKERHQFGAALASFQISQFKIAEMATWVKAARNLYYEAAWLVDQGKVDHALIAMAKWFSAEMSVRCVDEAVEIHGGYGYIDEFKVNRLYRAAKLLEIYEGTKEMQKIIISNTILGR